MLALRRKLGQWVVIDGRIRVKIERNPYHAGLYLIFDAPPEVNIVREELLDGAR